MEDYPIFSKPYFMGIVVGFLKECHVGVILASSESTSKKKRKISKKHSEKMAKKFKASRETLDISAEEPKAVDVTTSAGTTFGRIVPFEAHSLTVDNNSSIPLTTLSYNVPYVLEPILSEPIHNSSQTTNSNVTIPPPLPSLSEIPTSIIIPTLQPLFPLTLSSQLIQPENYP